MPDDYNNTQYYGVTVGAGIGLPGTEFHVEWGKTKTFAKINIFDTMRDIYHGIMAWCLIIIILSGMSFNCAAMASSHSSDEPYKQETLKQEFIRLSRIRRIWNLPSQCAMTMDVNDDNEIALHLRSSDKDYIVVIDKEGSLLFGYEFDVFKSLFGLLWEGSNLFVFIESGGTVITINNKGTIIEVNKVSSIDDKQLISSLNKSVGRLSKEVKDNRYELINKFGLLNPLVNYDYSTLVVHTSDGGYRCIFDVDLHKKLSTIMFILFYRYGIVLALYNIIRHYYTIPHKNNIIESSHVI